MANYFIKETQDGKYEVRLKDYPGVIIATVTPAKGAKLDTAKIMELLREGFVKLHE